MFVSPSSGPAIEAIVTVPKSSACRSDSAPSRANSNPATNVLATAARA
jgi:hypothetical protein